MVDMENGASPEVVAKEAKAALADLADRDLTGLTDAESEQHAIATTELLRLAEAAHVAAVARLDTSGAWAPSGARKAPAAFAGDEARLVVLATEQLFSRFETIIRHWIHRNDPDGVEADAASAFAERRVDCSETFEGTVVLDALLDR